MRSPLPPRPRVIQFNITSMIDVVFLLVIFFLVTSHFSRNDGGLDVNLPAAGKTTEELEPRRLTITVDAQGIYSVHGQSVSLAEIESLIAAEAGDDPAGLAIRIRGDRAAHYQQIEPILLSCAKHGVTRFGFNVIQK
ncbi:ExbD/TolR family protein [Planctomicrobium sp. SH664]|uniref:ExbD/TolR family protein n=1 Tax=Planctomicrobium sp. SH664 TaxID=3448125 RepID=UPI003F5BB18B